MRFNTGSSFCRQLGQITGPLYYFEDPNGSPDGQYLNLQRIFSPEEVGNLGKQDNKNTTNSTRATFGLQGAIGASNWKYIADFTYTENKLTEATYIAFTDKIENFFLTNFAGPQAGFGSGSASRRTTSTGPRTTARSRRPSMQASPAMPTPTPIPRTAWAASS